MANLKGILKRAIRASRRVESALSGGFPSARSETIATNSISLVVPKAGLSIAECEDFARAAYVRKGGTLTALRAAVSDGATEGAFSGVLARQLVDACLRSRRPSELSWLSNALEGFGSELASKNLPWHAQAKLDRGTFATLAVVDHQLARGVVEVTVVGDSCVTVIDANENVLDFVPIHRPEDFSKDPWLLSNLASHNTLVLTERVFRKTYKALSGATFICMTDALSRWFLEEHLSSHKPASTLCSFKDVSALGAFVDTQRALGKMRNDDVALAIVRILKK